MEKKVIGNRKIALIKSGRYKVVEKDREKYVYPIPKKKRKSYKGLFAPKGWLFQDIEYDFVSILRVAEKDWNIHWDAERDIHPLYDVEDAYAVLEGYESGKKIKGYEEYQLIDIWIVKTNQPIIAYSPIKNMEEGIRELICIAECVNSGNITNRKMDELRKKWGVGEWKRKKTPPLIIKGGRFFYKKYKIVFE